MIFILLGLIVLSLYFVLFDINRVDKDFLVTLKNFNDINIFIVFAGLVTAVILIIVSKMRIVNLLVIIGIFSVVFWGFFYSWDNVLTYYQKSRIDTFFQGPQSDPQGTGYQVIQSQIAICLRVGDSYRGHKVI